MTSNQTSYEISRTKWLLLKNNSINSLLFEIILHRIRNTIFRIGWLEEAKRLWGNEVGKRKVLCWKQIMTLLLSLLSVPRLIILWSWVYSILNCVVSQSSEIQHLLPNLLVANLAYRSALCSGISILAVICFIYFVFVVHFMMRLAVCCIINTAHAESNKDPCFFTQFLSAKEMILSMFSLSLYLYWLHNLHSAEVLRWNPSGNWVILISVVKNLTCTRIIWNILLCFYIFQGLKM